MHDVLLRDTDQMSMAHGLEVRVPLLDHRLVEYVMALPDVVKRPNGRPSVCSSRVWRAACRPRSSIGRSRDSCCRSIRGCAAR